MQAVLEGPEFTPPPEGGVMRSLGFAVLAHMVLALALSVGVQWKREDATIAVEAELWSPTVQQAAPKQVEAPPPAPIVEKQVVQPPPPPARTEADIAMERDKALAAQKAREEEAERQRRLAADRKRQEDLARQEQARQEQARQEQARQEQTRQEQARQEQARKASEDRKREEQAKVRRQKQDEERLAKLHDETIKRMQGLADATGLPSATGNATRSAGPSASYAGRLSALFQRNVLFPGGVDSIVGSPLAIVQVKVSPTGSIVSARLTRSSGNPAWDEAAVRAIERSERIPPDEDGRFQTDFPVEMRPRR